MTPKGSHFLQACLSLVPFLKHIYHHLKTHIGDIKATSQPAGGLKTQSKCTLQVKEN